MAEDYVARTSKEDMVQMMNANISDANKAIEHGNYISAVTSLNNAAFWAERIDAIYGSD